MKQRWVRFEHAGETGFGTLEGHEVRVHAGDMFDQPLPTGDHLPLTAVRLLVPTQPGKIIAMWNNFHALAKKLGLADPAEPLYLIKASSSLLAPGGTITPPRADGKVVFEGELGIVIGKAPGSACSGVDEAGAMRHVFGYTCGNDVTVADILHRDPSFPQWARAKSFDTFCPLGPVIATGLDAQALHVTTRLNGETRQDYPVSDMRWSVAQLVSRLSFDMTLHPGDVILCGTSVGVGSMKPGSLVEVEIDGIGMLSNRYG